MIGVGPYVWLRRARRFVWPTVVRDNLRFALFEHKTPSPPPHCLSYPVDAATMTTTASLPVRSVAEKVVDHGKHIFVYNNIRTNQVIYSLTRTLKVCSTMPSRNRRARC